MATVAGEMPPARTIALMTPIAAAATVDARLLLQGCARRTGFSVAASTILTDAIPEVQSGAQGSRAQPARPFYPWLTFDYG